MIAVEEIRAKWPNPSTGVSGVWDDPKGADAYCVLGAALRCAGRPQSRFPSLELSAAVLGISLVDTQAIIGLNYQCRFEEAWALLGVALAN